MLIMVRRSRQRIGDGVFARIEMMVGLKWWGGILLLRVEVTLALQGVRKSVWFYRR